MHVFAFNNSSLILGVGGRCGDWWQSLTVRFFFPGTSSACFLFLFPSLAMFQKIQNGSCVSGLPHCCCFCCAVAPRLDNGLVLLCGLMCLEVACLRARRHPEQPRLEPTVLAELAVQVKDSLRARAHARLQPRMLGLPPLLIHHPFAAQAARGAHRAGTLLTRGLAVHMGLNRKGPAGPCRQGPAVA